MEATWCTFILVAGIMFKSEASSKPDDGQTDEVQLELDKDILKHTIGYLREQLITCVSQTRIPHRKKRKAHSHLQDLLEYEIEMDMMKNTKAYLMERLISCRQTKYKLETLPSLSQKQDKGETSQLSSQLLFPAGSKVISDNQVMNQDTEKMSGKFYGKSESHLSRHHFGKSRERKDKHLNEVKVQTVAPQTTSTSAPTVMTTTAGTPQTFVVNGRAIECGSYKESDDASSFICRNVVVDDVWRLPNWDMCPPGYNPTGWRHLARIQSRTFSVLDLKSLCSEMGKVAGLGRKVRDVKVVWDCESTHYRVTFVNGKWTGSVEDNGYLRDLQCVFNTDLT